MENKNVLAVVGEKNITKQDVEALMKTLDPQMAMQLQSEDGQKRLVNELVNQELFYLLAKEENLEKEDAYQADLEKMKENLLKQYAINKLLRDITITDSEITNYYTENKAQFEQPAQVQASHILVDSEEKAQGVLAELKEGLSFEEAATKHSSCPSNAKGGDLGLFAQGQMVPEFEEAAFNMEVDTVSEPVKTQFGYHIIKVVDQKPAQEKSLAEVKDQLNQQLLSQKQQKAYFDKIEALKGQFTVTLNV
ncbi:PpiC-type peptidyl-prolyl cis-trans isomerase [Alkaliphilus metalliredigens QYMF]|uniref:PpiC-type peptidyl-prolyl cis-trans isomerase n=1 Tax=Alkaliphilus metalliredigens (strain QYMF) TaxID=293826 RepID=A6TNW7_ALKMQ|nr:peptidylprolyl isomerase [Alkaliphilus metalliredigens]ABR47885.1 PpiC-type peptidyl-prolyl cis-trans isomerase [Alkaliphilus metalliredigens QYMF]